MKSSYFFLAKETAKKMLQRTLYPIQPYWTANVYGFGKWIRRYGFYPPVLPLCIYTDHSPGERSGQPFPHELQSNAPVQFYHAKSAVNKWKRKSKKPCYPLYSPFVFARKILKIQKKKNAKGTIFFPAHTTPSIDDNKTVDQYCDELDALPIEFIPVTVCMHIHDIRKGLAEKYNARNYIVVSAGDSLNQNFIGNFYNMMCNHKFALSNIFGSYALYAVEMDIPFGLYGAEPDYFNHSDSNVEKGKYTSYSEGKYYKKAKELFAGLPVAPVSKAQKNFAIKYLGLQSGITRFQMSKILYKSLIIWIYNSIKDILYK